MILLANPQRRASPHPKAGTRPPYSGGRIVGGFEEGEIGFTCSINADSKGGRIRLFATNLNRGYVLQVNSVTSVCWPTNPENLEGMTLWA